MKSNCMSEDHMWELGPPSKDFFTVSAGIKNSRAKARSYIQNNIGVSC
jgi:hypothetical protein